MPVINTNVSAMYSQNAMKTNARAQSTAMEQLSTGTRVNSAKDDAAGLAIGQNMTSQIRGLNMAVRNLNDGINMMQTAEGAMVEQSNMLQRMRELAVQSMNGTYSDTQRSYIDKEFQALSQQIGRISSDTMWNDQRLLGGASFANLTVTAGANADGFSLAAGSYPNGQVSAAGVPAIASGMIVPNTIIIASGTAITGIVGTGYIQASFTFQAGKDAGQNITVKIAPMSVTGLGIQGLTISTLTTATSTLGNIATALETINNQRAGIGAAINQMEYAADNLTNVSTNATQSRSTIMDTDYALATSQLAKTQIIQQAATAMLAQANQQPQSVLSLLKG